MTFQIGDKVVYPNHGIGVVEDILADTLPDSKHQFYKLRILANSTVVKVPVQNVDGVGLRRVITGRDVERIFDLLENRKIEQHSNWKGRYKDNSDKMRSGSIYDVAGVLKDLSYLSKKKSLSFREKRMLDRARFLIVSELAEVAEEPQDLVEQKIDIALSRGMEAKKKGRTSLKTLLKKTTLAAMAESGRTEGVARKVRSRASTNGKGRKKPISITINRYCC
ncbi:MAG TPA: CarD family transcriptional regulator [Vicinamibacteria bacterium]|nr:CarD family transcriptional regulator [Vicinamibacteria bacterium]